jgi:hypothetical protein
MESLWRNKMKIRGGRRWEQEYLQGALTRGWEELKRSADFRKMIEYYDFLQKVGFYESRFRNCFPHPAYDAAAQFIGRYFLISARHIELSFDEPFPGSFSASKEHREPGYDTREFRLTAFRRNDYAHGIVLAFAHCHDRFDLPIPPKLKLEGLDNKVQND